MIGLFILALRSSTPASLVPETFGPSRIHIPKAPSLGLLLVAPHYIEYNRRVVEANDKLDSLVRAGRLTPDAAEEQRRAEIDPAKVDGMTVLVDEFKREQVYKRMWEVEERDLTFSKWLNYLDQFVGADFECVLLSLLSPPPLLCSARPDELRSRAGTSTPRASSPPRRPSPRARTRSARAAQRQRPTRRRRRQRARSRARATTRASSARTTAEAGRRAGRGPSASRRRSCSSSTASCILSFLAVSISPSLLLSLLGSSSFEKKVRLHCIATAKSDGLREGGRERERGYRSTGRRGRRTSCDGVGGRAGSGREGGGTREL